MNYLEFAFKGTKYARNLVFLLILAQFLKYLKKQSGCFFYTNICRKLRLSVISSSQWHMSLVSIFLSYLKKSNAHSWSAWFLGVTQKYELRVSFKFFSSGYYSPLYTSPLNRDAIIHITKVEHELIPNPDMYFFLKKGIRGTVSYIF